MFRKFTKDREVLCPVIYAEQHTTSPGHAAEETIIRNHRNAEQPKSTTNLYDKARGIYFRAQRSRRSRSASIL